MVKLSADPAGVSCPHSSKIVFPSVPFLSVIVNVPPCNSGCVNRTVISFDEFTEALQLPLAEATVTGYAPAIMKSLPSAATVEQSIGFLNSRRIALGLHFSGARLSIGVGTNG